ncbi:unnamed protein product [Chrysoparadoxa australica]
MQVSGSRYGTGTRTGNWYEDRELESCSFRQFQAKKGSNALCATAQLAKINLCTMPVSLAYNEEGKVCFGDTVTIESAETGTALSCDPFESTFTGSKEYIITVARDASQPIARSAFKLLPVTKKSLLDWRVSSGQTASEGDPIQYGEGFHLICYPSLRVDSKTGMRHQPLYLTSTLRNELKASKVSNRQLVYLQATACSDAVWTLQKAVAGKEGSVHRLLSEGVPVLANDPLVIQHRNTATNLCCDKQFVTTTDFGGEYELSCHNATTCGKQLQLAAELSGRRTAGTAAKAELNVNRWCIRMAETLEEGQAAIEYEASLPEPLTGEALLSYVVSQIVQQEGVTGLTQAFHRMDPASNGKLDREDLKWALLEAGLSFDEHNFTLLLDHFDKNGDGYVNIGEFMSAFEQEG